MWAFAHLITPPGENAKALVREAVYLLTSRRYLPNLPYFVPGPCHSIGSIPFVVKAPTLPSRVHVPLGQTTYL